jgi:hypothetical protein
MEYRYAAFDAIDAIEKQPVQMDIDVGEAQPKRWMSVTTPVCASVRLKPACLIRKVEMARLIPCDTGDSRCGWLTNR